MALCECGENVDASCMHRNWCTGCLEKKSFTLFGQVFHPNDRDGNVCPCEMICDCVPVCAVPDLCDCIGEGKTCTRLITRHDPYNNACSQNNSFLTFVNPRTKRRRQVLVGRPYQCKDCPRCKWPYGASTLRQTIVCDAEGCGFRFCSLCEAEDGTKDSCCSLEQKSRENERKPREYIVIDDESSDDDSSEDIRGKDSRKKRKVE